MIGFSGMLHHALITHKGPIDQIMTSDFVSLPPKPKALGMRAFPA